MTHEVGLEVLALQEVAAEINADGKVFLARVHFCLERLVVTQQQLHAGHVPIETSSSNILAHLYTRMDNQRASSICIQYNSHGTRVARHKEVSNWRWSAHHLRIESPAKRSVRSTSVL